MSERGAVPGVPTEVKGLSAVSLLNDCSSEMVYPVLPAFLTGTLGASPLALGALDGAAELTAAAVKWGSGRLADRPRWAAPLILAGYGIAGAVRPLIALAGSAWQVVGFRVVDRVGKGLRSPPRDALIAGLTAPSVRGRAFGFHRAADHLGAVLGSLAAWALLSRQVEVRAVIGYSAIPGVLAVLVLIAVLRRAAAKAGVSPGAAAPQARVHQDADARGRKFWAPVAVLVLLAAGRLPETLLLLRLQDFGVSLAAVPLLWGALHVVRSAASYPGGILSDRLGVRVAVALGALLYAGIAAGLGVAAGAGGVGLFLGYGLVAGVLEPAERVAVAKLAPVRTGRGFGTYQGLAGLAALPAGLLFGACYASLGGPAALFVSGGVLLLGVVLWLTVSDRVPVSK